MPLAVRVLVSAALLALVLSQVEWRDVLGALARAELSWLLVALLAFNGSMIVASKRWQLILGAGGGTQVSSRVALAATYVSLWLSNFLPTAFGGDIMRVLTARRAGARLSLALASAVLDRYLGLTTLAVLFFLFEAALAGAGHPRPLLPLAAAFAVGSAALLVLLWGGSHLPLRRRWLRSRTVRFAARSMGLLRALGGRPAVSVRVMAASVVAIMLGVAGYWGAIRCVSSNVDLSTALAVAALGTLASAIPVSLSGWGVREGTVAVVLSQTGSLSASDASLVAILNGAAIGVTSLIGLAISLSVGWSSGARDGAARGIASGHSHGVDW